MKVKEIELCFENVEVCKLKPNMFKYLIIQGIKQDKVINCYQYEKRRDTNFFEMRLFLY